MATISVLSGFECVFSYYTRTALYFIECIKNFWNSNRKLDH